MDVESVCDELYGLPLEEFIPTRTDREKQAKSAGDKGLAAQIHQLAKPNLVAWLANQLARERADEIGPLLELGAGLREATAALSGEALRELSRQQRRLVYALVQQARRLANGAGRQVSADTARGLEDTLRAALADPEAADALVAGRLTVGMQNSGFGSPAGRDGGPARPVEQATAATAAASPPARQHALEQAEHDVELAKSAADEAVTARQVVLEQLEAADQRFADAEGQVERVRRELDEALQAQSRAREDQLCGRAAFDRADRGARDAQQHLADATKRLDGLAR